MGKILTKEIAQKLLAKGESSELSKYTDLASDAAEVLASFPGHLELNGLKKLDEKVAKAFMRHEGGCLFLNGLTEISEPLAGTLAKYQGWGIELEGVAKISDAVAQALAKFKKGSLSLGLTELSECQARLLGKHSCKDSAGDLSLEKLKSLSANAAQALAKHKGGCLNLNGIVELSDEAVLGLIQIDGGLSLNRLEKISDQGLESLIKFHKDGGVLYAGRLRERIMAAKAKEPGAIKSKK